MKSLPHSPVLLIAESGATKTAWKLCKQGQVLHSFQTEGLNPSNFSDQGLKDSLHHIYAQHLSAYAIESLYFFGAGLRHPETRQKLAHIWDDIFPGIKDIYLKDDLHAAILATQREKGIVAILGTGSNACLFDQGEPIKRRGGLGYLLGDEGSGMDLGKSLVKGILEEAFSPSTSEKILSHLQLDSASLRDKVYSAEKPALFFSELAPVVKQFDELEEIQALIRNRLRRFLQQCVSPLVKKSEVPIDFVGSIAFHFRDLLQGEMAKEKLQFGRIIRRPMDVLPAVLSK